MDRDMRSIVAFVCVTLWPLSAYTAECVRGSPMPISVIEWSLTEPNHQGLSLLEFTYRNETEDTIRMLNAWIYFDDILGERVGGYEMDRDIRLAPSETATRKEIIGFYMPRLQSLNPEDVRVTICTRAVVFDDGSVKRYD